MNSLGILKFEVDHSFYDIGGYFLTVWVKQLDHYLIHLLLEYLSAQGFFKDLFEAFFVDLSLSVLVQHFRNQLALVQLIKVLSHLIEIFTEADGFSLLWEFIDKIKDWLWGMMIVLINHSFLEFGEVNFPIEKSKLRFEIFNFFFCKERRILVLFIRNVEISLFFAHRFAYNEFVVWKYKKIYSKASRVL